MPLTVQASVSYLQQQNIPVIGGDASSATWWQSPVLFPQGSSDIGSDQAVFTIKAAAAKGYTKMGVVYCVEDPTCSNGIQSLIQPGGGAQAGVDHRLLVVDQHHAARLHRTVPRRQAGRRNLHLLRRRRGQPHADGERLRRAGVQAALRGGQHRHHGQPRIRTPTSTGCWPARRTSPGWTASRRRRRPTSRRSSNTTPNSPARQRPRLNGRQGCWPSRPTRTSPPPRRRREFFQGLWSIKNNNLGGLAPPLTFNQGGNATPSNCFFLMTLQNGQFVDLQNGNTTCVS